MPTNEERREVAKELRYTSSHSLNGYSFQRAVEGIVFGTIVDRPWRETLTRLADLIEPEERTCNVKHWNNASGVAFTRGECSECGGYLLENIHMQKPHPYCPHCGAKVVQE